DGNQLLEFFRWTGSSTQLTPAFQVNVDQPLLFEAQYVRNVTPNISFTRSGLTFNRATQIYYGTLTIKNNGSEVYSNGIPVELTGLPAGVELVNRNGVFHNNPWLATPGISGFAPGASLVIPLQFKIPAGTRLNYGVQVYDFQR